MSFPGMSDEQIRQLLLQLSLSQPNIDPAGAGLGGSDPTASLGGGVPPPLGQAPSVGLAGLDPSYLLPGSRAVGPHNPTPVQEKLFDEVGRGIDSALNARSAPNAPSANERLGRLGSQILDPDLFRAGSVAPPTSRLDAIGKGLESGARQVGNFFMNLTPAGVPVRALGGAMAGFGEAKDFLTEQFAAPFGSSAPPGRDDYRLGGEGGVAPPGFIGPLPVEGQAGAPPLGQHRMPDGTMMPNTAMPGAASGAPASFGSARPAGKDDWATRPGVTPTGGGAATPGGAAGPGGAAPPGGGGLAPVPPAGTAGAAGGPLNAEFQRYIQEVDPGAYADLLNQQRGRDPNRDFWSGLENRQAGVAQSLFPIMEDQDPTNNENEFATYLRGNLEGRRQPGGRTDFRGALLRRLGDPAGATEMLAALGVEGQVDQNQIASVANNVGKLVETVQTQGGRFGALARQRGIRARQAVMAAFSQSIQGGGTALSDADLARIIQQHL